VIPEIVDYLERVEGLRNEVRALVADLPAEALNWRPIAGSGDHATNSLAVMAAHVAGAEHFWIGEVVGELPPTRVRDVEFQTEVTSAAPLLERLDAVAAETRAVLAQVSAEKLGQVRTVRQYTVTNRWAILHVIDHTALHLGHMQLTYQLWQSSRVVAQP
jgi:uncharacterized damage-inducible protein DinB